MHVWVGTISVQNPVCWLFKKIFKKFPYPWGLCVLGLCCLQPPVNAGTVAATWEGGRAESGCATACSWVRGPCGSVLLVVFYQKLPLRSSSGPASPKWGNLRLPCVANGVSAAAVCVCPSLCLLPQRSVCITLKSDVKFCLVFQNYLRGAQVVGRHFLARKQLTNVEKCLSFLMPPE